MSEPGRTLINDRMALLSLGAELPSSFAIMAEPSPRSALYLLIEAGQRARQALLVPLHERGLEPGDDAVLFILHGRLGSTEEALAAELGVGPEPLATRIARLIERDLVARQAIGPDLTPGLALTRRGERIRELLAANWQQLEDALLGELGKKRRKTLRRTLSRFVQLLRL